MLLGFSPLAILAACLLGVAHALYTVVGYLRWLVIPPLLVVLVALRPLVAVFSQVSLDGVAYCSGEAATFWQQLWAPSNFLVLTFVAVMSVGFFIKARSANPQRHC